MRSSDSELSILFVGTQMEVAGAQKVMLSQARCFYEKGYKVQAAFFYDKQGLLEKWQGENPFPVHSLRAWKYGANPMANAFRLMGGLFRLFSLMQKRVDVAETFTPHSNVLALPLAWLAKVPLRIATHHGYIENSSATLARVNGWMTNNGIFSIQVAVSSQVKEYAIDVEGARPEAIEVIENGIEPLSIKTFDSNARKSLRESIGVRESELMLLTVGRLTIQKGHSVLIRAIKEIGDKQAHAVFAFAGEGKQRQNLQDEAKKLGVLDRIRFLGVRKDIASLLAAADMFVQPSLWEGLSLAMLEALLSGTVVLATEVEGVVDVIEHRKNGWLVPANDVESLARGIDQLISEPNLRASLGKAGRAHAEKNYSIEKMCNRYDKLVQDLWSEKIAG